ncbi:hypothetical protein ACH4Q6_02785 [Streptomyces lydicus]|uniref:hypothetical protein n=1 Tax=Streptomyces lydicus TaxID=47763 RepID=UPI00378D3CCA
MAREEVTRLTGTGNGNGDCDKDDCPHVYRTASGSFVVQGYDSTGPGPRDRQRGVRLSCCRC